MRIRNSLTLELAISVCMHLILLLNFYFLPKVNTLGASNSKPLEVSIVSPKKEQKPSNAEDQKPLEKSGDKKPKDNSKDGDISPIFKQIVSDNYNDLVKSMIDPKWVRDVTHRMKVLKANGQYIPHVTTEVIIKTDASGRVLLVTISKPSGREDFDKIALDACMSVDTLPPPPKVLLDNDGILVLTWSFTVGEKPN